MAKLTMDQFQRKVRRWRRKFPDAIREALERGGERILHEVHTKHLSGPKIPRGEGHPTNATLQPQSGRLKTSVHYRVRSTSRETSLTVGTNVIYAGVHEHGYKKRNIPARPFLQPSVDAKRDAILDDVSESIVAAYNRMR